MKKQRGLTLIEIMIALALGLFIIAATISVYINAIRMSSDTVKLTRLNHDLDMGMNLMVNDIKRAGSWSGAKLGVDSRTNPFTATATNIQIPSTNCILYTYDGDVANGIVDTTEYYGFKLEGGTLKMRLAGSSATATSCTGANEWQDFIDSDKLFITDLQFSFAAMPAQAAVANVHPAYPALTATSSCLNTSKNTNSAATAATVSCPASIAIAGDNVGVKRVVNIRLTGYVDDNKNKAVDANEWVSKTLSTTIKVRNDRLYIP